MNIRLSGTTKTLSPGDKSAQEEMRVPQGVNKAQLLVFTLEQMTLVKSSLFVQI